MPRVSKRSVPPQLLDRMVELLAKTIRDLNETKTIVGFLDEVLTSSEKIMLAKRIALALLIARGWDNEAINRYLKLSNSTISLMRNKLTSGNSSYHRIISQIESGSEWEQTWLELKQALEEIIAERIVVGRRVTKPAIRDKYHQKREKYKVL